MNEIFDSGSEKSSTAHARAVAALETGVMRWQDLVQIYDEAVGARYGLNAKERQALSVLAQGARTAGEIAQLVGLKPSSITALLDRLEQRGFLGRQPDPEDRRRTNVVASDKTLAMIAECYAPLAEEGRKLWSQYSDAELTLFAELMARIIKVQEDALRRLEG